MATVDSLADLRGEMFKILESLEGVVEVRHNEATTRGSTRLECASLDAALEALDRDSESMKASGVTRYDLIDAYIGVKMNEVTTYPSCVHEPAEYQKYYSICAGVRVRDV